MKEKTKGHCAISFFQICLKSKVTLDLPYRLQWTIGFQSFKHADYMLR